MQLTITIHTNKHSFIGTSRASSHWGIWTRKVHKLAMLCVCLSPCRLPSVYTSLHNHVSSIYAHVLVPQCFIHWQTCSSCEAYKLAPITMCAKEYIMWMMFVFCMYIYSHNKSTLSVLWRSLNDKNITKSNYNGYTCMLCPYKAFLLVLLCIAILNNACCLM